MKLFNNSESSWFYAIGIVIFVALVSLSWFYYRNQDEKKWRFSGVSDSSNPLEFTPPHTPSPEKKKEYIVQPLPIPSAPNVQLEVKTIK